MPGYAVFTPLPSHGRAVFQTLNDGGWHHVVATHRFAFSSASKLYLDGKDVPASFVQLTPSYPAAVTNSDLFIGKQDSASAGFFRGLLDDVRIYNRVLTEGEISTLVREGGWEPEGSPAALPAPSAAPSRRSY